MIQRIKLFVSNKQKVFLILAFLMFVITIAIFIFFILNLGLDINESVESSSKFNPSEQKKMEFDIEGFKNLNL